MGLLKKGVFPFVTVNLLFVLFLYSLSRLFFLLFQKDFFSGISSQKIVDAFFWGARFDISAIFLSNIPFILLCLTPVFLWQWKSYRVVVAGVFFTVNSLFLLMGFSESQYFAFTQRRMTKDIVFLMSDAMKQSSALLSDYWLLILFWFASVAALIVVYRKSYKMFLESRPFLSWKPQLLARVLLLLFAVSASRGGWQIKPLSVAHAMNLQNHQASTLALNSPFTFILSWLTEDLPLRDDFANLEEAYRQMGPVTCPSNRESENEKKTNVVLLIIESLALEYMGVANKGDGYTPFLDGLSQKGLLFQTTLANGTRSIEALPSLLAGVPNLLPQAFVTTAYVNSDFPSLGSHLQKRGYKTLFFHGGFDGTMYFDSTAPRMGLDQYYGYSAYPEKKRDYDGSWGIYDGPFLQFARETLDQTATPFFATIFTLSSHHPYKVPEELYGRFPKGDLPIHESIGYADWAVKEFFKEARKSSWYDNTLFVITADHTQKSSRKEYQNVLGRRRIPILFYHPQQKITVKQPKKLVQQIDIPASILDYLGEQESLQLPFGRSVFDDCNDRFAVLWENGIYWLHTTTSSYRYDPAEDRFQAFSVAGNDLEKRELMSSDKVWLTRLRATLQFFNNGLRQNKWKRFLRRRSVMSSRETQ